MQSPVGQPGAHGGQPTPGMQGIATGPLLAQKVVQLPKQARGGAGAQQQGDITDSKVFRGGKIKLDRLKKAELEGSPQRTRQKQLQLIELEQRQGSRKDGIAGKAKVTTAAIAIQRAGDEESKHEALAGNPNV